MTATSFRPDVQKGGGAACFLGSVLRAESWAQTLQLERFLSGKSMSAERPELGAGRVFKVFGMAGEGLGSRDMPRQRSILWQERGSLRGCVARVDLALLTIGSSGKVSRLWAVVTTQESEGTISESNFKKVTLD